MEIESSKNGSKIRLQQQQSTELGRGRGLLLDLDSSDRTVSRRHVCFNLQQHYHHPDDDDDDDGGVVCFQVKGKNPIWVRHADDGVIRVYKTSQRGQLKPGDSFCLSSKNPVWFYLNKIAAADDQSNTNLDISGVDVSDLHHPVKEFNFVVMGHEFDSYPKKLIRDMRNWNWFLEEPNQDSDEEDESKSKKVVRKKRKKGDDDDDDVWTGESEEDVELINKSRNDLKPKYSTRSKDKTKKGAGSSKRAKDDAKVSDEEQVEDDDEDETLGGFIVDDEDIGEGNEEDDEEEEFEDDEDDE